MMIYMKISNKVIILRLLKYIEMRIWQSNICTVYAIKTRMSIIYTPRWQKVHHWIKHVKTVFIIVFDILNTMNSSLLF